VTIAAGLVWRLAPLTLPFLLYKYGGSALWAAMLYWLVAALLPRQGAGPVTAGAGSAATIVECSRLYHSPGLDAFRLTLSGKLLLGRYFSLRDIAVYWAAILVCRGLDAATRRRSNPAG
jgi:hypothetical protein